LAATAAPLLCGVFAGADCAVCGMAAVTL
jgi:hypothetical protein